MIGVSTTLASGSILKKKKKLLLLLILNLIKNSNFYSYNRIHLLR